MSAININHDTCTISTNNNELLILSDKGAVKLGSGSYLDEIPNLDEYKGALRYNEDKGVIQYCDGIKWIDIDGDYKQTSLITWSLLF